MKTWVLVFTLIGIVALSACQSPAPSIPAPPQPSVHAAITTAWGKVVDDPSGKPLAHVRVALEPWKPCRAVPRAPMYLPPWTHKNWPPPSAWPQPEHLVCPKPVVVTKTDRKGKFTIRVPRGHYLLVIGSDSTTDLVRPTIHDNVVISGGTQHLVAPTPCPSINPPYYKHCLPVFPLETPPAVERTKNYRLLTIDQKYEKPCITGFDAQREARNLEDVVVDEWLTEDNRRLLDAVKNPKYVPVARPFGGLTSGFAYSQGGSGVRSANGHPGCWTWNTDGPFFYNPEALPFSIDPRTHWYAGTYGRFNRRGEKGNLMGNSQYPRDPRADFTDPNVSVWP